MRLAKLTALGLLAALVALAPDAAAQRGHNRRHNRRAAAGAHGLFGARRRPIVVVPPKGPRAAPTSAPTVTGAPKSGVLSAEEQHFRALIGEIDDKLAQFDQDRSAAQERADALGFDLPAGLEPGTLEWRNLQRPIFQTCDYDAGGWLSFREMRAALDVDRAEFALYDRDRDGRVGPREFMARYDDVVGKSGAFRLPRPKDAGGGGAPRSADQLRSAFDADGDARLDRRELSALLADYGRAEVDPALLLDKLDLDRSQGLEGAELFQLARLIAVTFVLRPGDEPARPRAASVEQLFGALIPRPGGLDTSAAPPWIPGPVPHFRRLDLDGDGFIDAAELRELQGSLTLRSRLGAVLAALDLDEDGRLSEREFLNSLTAARK